VTTLSTDWSRAMGLDAPIVNAPMGGVAGGALAAAVSRAGVGIGSAGSTLQLDEQLGHLRGLGRPFGIGLVEWVVASEPQLLSAAINAEPALLSVSFGEDFPGFGARTTRVSARPPKSVTLQPLCAQSKPDAMS
jgi:nitronate monooxygenase